MKRILVLLFLPFIISCQKLDKNTNSQVIGTFAGLEIAPAPLCYNSEKGFEIKDDDWNHHSYMSATGKKDGSYYFSHIDLGTYFDSRQESFQDEYLIDNHYTITYRNHGDWRIPTKEEWERIITTEATIREGSTINNERNKHYVITFVEGIACGLLIFPDGRIIQGTRLLNMDVMNRDSIETISVLSHKQLDEYLQQGCAFLPGFGIDYKTGGQDWGKYASTSKDCIVFGEMYLYIGNKYDSNSTMVRLIRNSK